jgi:hypothetical protein
MNNTITQEIDLEDAVLGEGLFKKYSYAGFFNLIDNPNTQTNFINFLVKEALANSPELKNIGYNLNAVDRSYKLNNWGRLMPTFGVQGQYNLDFVRSGVGTQPSIGFPIFQIKTTMLGYRLLCLYFKKIKEI